MRSEMEDACTFLDAHGRCSVHTCRPGFCRLYPMGRYYDHEKRDFWYILQVGECIRPDLKKIRVKKWLGIPQLPRYEQYIRDWHFFLTDVMAMLERNPALRKDACMYILRLFFLKPYDTAGDFYTEFAGRLQEGKDVLLAGADSPQ